MHIFTTITVQLHKFLIGLFYYAINIQANTKLPSLGKNQLKKSFRNMPGHSKTNQSKKDGKNQESIQSSTTHDPGYHMGK